MGNGRGNWGQGMHGKWNSQGRGGGVGEIQKN